MKEGTKLQSGILYYTKTGSGDIIPFNNGRYLDGTHAIITPWETDSTDVWTVNGLLCRNIKGIAETKEDAEKICYGKS